MATLLHHGDYGTTDVCVDHDMGEHRLLLPMGMLQIDLRLVKTMDHGLEEPGQHPASFWHQGDENPDEIF